MSATTYNAYEDTSTLYRLGVILRIGANSTKQTDILTHTVSRGANAEIVFLNTSDKSGLWPNGRQTGQNQTSLHPAAPFTGAAFSCLSNCHFRDSDLNLYLVQYYLMQEELIQIKNDAMSLILNSDSRDDIEKIYIEFLGKKGRLTLALKEIPKLKVEERAEIGKLANSIIDTLQEQINDRRAVLKNTPIAPKQAKNEKISAKSQTPNDIDVTLPGNRPPLGSLHLVTQAIEEITSIFEKIGFTKVRYPEVEYDYYAFGALNFPDNHPARDDWETFFVDLPEDSKKGPILLTPHTSSGQVRELEKGKLPVKMLNIAKCYRRQSDVSHTQMFHQFEGLVVAEGINISHLKGVLDFFVKSFFGEERTFRIRPYHFQFTEPSFEIDITCGVCLGSGKINNETCRLCKGGWLELGGAGMVHPQVLKAGNVDTKKYTGFAFGWGVERVLMMKEGIKIDDLRLLYSNELDFLEQF